MGNTVQARPPATIRIGIERDEPGAVRRASAFCASAITVGRVQPAADPAVKAAVRA